MSNRALVLLFGLLLAAGCNRSAAQSDAGKSASGAPVEATFVSIHVPGMTCPGGCAPVVEQTLAALPGVKECKVDFPTKIARCAIDPDKFDASAAIAALAKEGFEKSELDSQAQANQ